MSRSSAPSRDKQKTIGREFVLEGIGIHSGVPCVAHFRPAKPDCGIYFILNGEKIPANLASVTGTRRGTSLSGLHVVEHILAAACGLGITNLEIELSSPEPPILDGSALPFLQALKKASIVEQEFRVPVIKVAQKISVKDKSASLTVLPYRGFKVHFMIEFPYIGRQEFAYTGDFEGAIAPARTFGLIEELESLKKEGLAKGASFNNSLAIGQNGYVNPARFPDEPVRHKVLDLIGDLSLVSCSIEGEIIAVKSGHKLNIELARRLLEI
ncbi:MAG TPA: UDP-3-O-acyl-N-acetylglucosamine deacetylase [Candidatus Omnitrophota bacterium]|nr:UDP-3-O-acyl-N-acetylglucosamine deacetylase [Candidatus Omnitrophota bacterium]